MHEEYHQYHHHPHYWFNVLKLNWIHCSCCFLSITEKVNRGFLAPTTFFIIIVFYLLRSLLANPDASCNPFVTYSTYFVSIIDIILVCISGCWMAYRIQSPAKEEEALDVEEGEKPEFKIPEEGK